MRTHIQTDRQIDYEAVPFDKHSYTVKNIFTLWCKVVSRVIYFDTEFSFSVHILGSILRYQITHKTIHSMRAERNRLEADTQCYERRLISSVLSSNMQTLLRKLSASICHAVPALVERASSTHWPGQGFWVDARAFLHPHRVPVELRPDSRSWTPLTGLLDHTYWTHHTRQDSSGRLISSKHRPLPDNLQAWQQTNIHAPGGIRTHNPSNTAAADPRLPLRGHWDRQEHF